MIPKFFIGGIHKVNSAERGGAWRPSRSSSSLRFGVCLLMNLSEYFTRALRTSIGTYGTRKVHRILSMVVIALLDCLQTSS
jgi:hypothetical protein